MQFVFLRTKSVVRFWKFVCHNDTCRVRGRCEGTEKRKNCQFYASTCFESLSDCRIMNQNHKIDNIQILPHITFQAETCVPCDANSVYRGRESERHDTMFVQECFRKIFLPLRNRQAFIQRQSEREICVHPLSLFRFPGTQNEINASVGDNLLHGMQL